jgi:Xaa-Pro dipeptidase
MSERSDVLDAMAEHGIDVLVLGRQDDAVLASGARRLWTAGTRPFGAGCVVVAATGRVHVLSSWDAGIPPAVPFEDLYPLTWNPAVMAASMRAIEGFAEAARIGVDALSPSFLRAVGQLAPGAEVVPADDLLAAVRRRKDAAEIEQVRAACAVAWVGVDAAVLGGGVADVAEALARAGVTVPSSGIRVEPAADGRALVIDVGVLLDGWEGGVGGRFTDGSRAAPPPLIATCRDGATWTDLAAAARSPAWCVRGVGRGFERPVLDPDLGRHERLEEGMVLSVADGDHRDVVAVTSGAPDVLSSLRSG